MHTIVRPAVLAAVLASMLWAPALFAAEPLPVPPCAGTPVPAVPSPDGPPKVTLWHPADRPADWVPPTCSGLGAPGDGVVVALSGSFRHDGEMSDLLAKLGAISTHTGIVYWSTQDAAWRPMLLEAAALTGADPESRRDDFKVEEMRSGALLHLLYDDDGAPGPVVFETEVRAADADELLLVSRNVTAMTLMGMTIAEPGELSSMLSVRRVEPGLFDYYALSSITVASLAAAMIPDAAHINRAVGSFRFLAGIPGDLEPPAAPE
jgi:hypothetical protein